MGVVSVMLVDKFFYEKYFNRIFYGINCDLLNVFLDGVVDVGVFWLLVLVKVWKEGFELWLDVV